MLASSSVGKADSPRGRLRAITPANGADPGSPPAAPSLPVCSWGSWCSGGKIQLNMRKNFFPLRVMEPWPRQVVESPSLEIFKTHLDKVLFSLL